MPVGPTTRAGAKMLKESFGNLAKSFVEEMHQEWAKKEKIKLNGPDMESGQPKTLIVAQWQ